VQFALQSRAALVAAGVVAAVPAAAAPAAEPAPSAAAAAAAAALARREADLAEGRIPRRVAVLPMASLSDADRASMARPSGGQGRGRRDD
jgi:hypothetical protein